MRRYDAIFIVGITLAGIAWAMEQYKFFRRVD
jgi:hypothetical protein